MNCERVEKIINSVLYEGYMLYPYRPSAIKNRQRWNFGVIYPATYGRREDITESWSMQTELLVIGTELTTLDVKARFLHLVAREISQLVAGPPESEQISPQSFRAVESLEVGGQVFQPWQEVVERDANAWGLRLNDLVTQPLRLSFSFPPSRKTEMLSDPSGPVVGLIVTRQESLDVRLEIAAEACGNELFRVSLRVLNLTELEGGNLSNRDEILMRSLVSTHAIFGLHAGEFVSLSDPPEPFRQVAAACRNIGTWPVLVGEEGERDMMLSSPIILYDYPKVAPESTGNLFDGTEIDELLTLRIMTLTDEEKRAMSQGDERARQILERTETMSLEQMMKFHGGMRSLERL